jgi:pantoate--beta-alanine ligase
MIRIENRQELNNLKKEAIISGKKIGFVPTMGSLHKGHLSLIERSKAENDITICSVYVNPTQFNDSKDFNRYPRDVENDIKLLKTVGCDYVFTPSDSEMYPEKMSLNISFGHLETVMEGKFRPGHFNGVGVVVAKLFNLVKADRAYFGQKDLQQTVIIKKLIETLSFDIQLVICDTLREESGLAMSSRNALLADTDRVFAPMVFQSLTKAKELYLKGENIKTIIEKSTAELLAVNRFKLEYFEIVDLNTLNSIENNLNNTPIAICIACFLGEIRLIDNLVLS